MEKISVVIITKNEENNIERCLESVSWADEIVIVDSGSNDSTIDICNKYKCKVIDSEWLGFGLTKQKAVANTKNDIILSLDADEEVSKELSNFLNSFTTDDFKYAYKIKRKTFYIDKLIRFCGWNKDYQLRIFNKKQGNFNINELHEFVETEQEVKTIKAHINHYSYPSISFHINKINYYTDISAKALFKSNKKSSLFKAILHAKLKFIKMYLLQLGFLDGKSGLVLSLNSAFGVYLKYLKLYKMNSVNKA